jgi:hypothetical protein
MASVQSLSEPLIRARDAALAALFGAGRCESDGSASDGLPSNAAAADLMRAMNRIKALAISDDGAHVDYARLRHSDAYAEYRRAWLPRLRAFDPACLTTREERLAFWINLYNALVMDSVVAFGVQRSVTEGRLGLLTFFRRAAYAVGGMCVSCDDIEHGILRANAGSPFIPGPQFAPRDLRAAWVIRPLDPRIHFALNCASRSCPPIGVYDAARLDQQLDLAARGFVDGSAALDRANGVITLSPIFKWYARDFGGRAGVISFLIAYLPDDDRRDWLRQQSAQARLIYQPYDWRLNI